MNKHCQRRSGGRRVLHVQSYHHKSSQSHDEAILSVKGKRHEYEDGSGNQTYDVSAEHVSCLCQSGGGHGKQNEARGSHRTDSHDFVLTKEDGYYKQDGPAQRTLEDVVFPELPEFRYRRVFQIHTLWSGTCSNTSKQRCQKEGEVMDYGGLPINQEPRRPYIIRYGFSRPSVAGLIIFARSDTKRRYVLCGIPYVVRTFEFT
jgi:hypothetical protein